ncbi:WSC domain-containing protein [Apiosordaria backusii]|uniref:WSC domain-containing protein n=1 Tax=Apiosordaria backusii TaxID=314023 RepID=A0AA40B7M0_9PEZI|nr:WSC domain-containing protein [Apiosordaria backusii]
MKLLILLLLSILGLVVTAQDTTTTTTTNKQQNGLVIQTGAQGYTYHGCYTETTNIANTTGKRALDGGINSVQPDNMTVQKCWEFCGGKGSSGQTYKFAGLEYARECWCAQSLSGLSSKVADSECDLPCDGNSTQACGGNLKLTVYIASAAANLAARFSFVASLGVIGVMVFGSVFE